MVRSLVPFVAPLPEVMRRFGEFGNEFFAPWDGEELFARWKVEEFTPRLNVVEGEKEVEVTVELPGMKPEEFNVELKNNELWITGEKKSETEEKGKSFRRIETHYGSFERMIRMPTEVTAEKIVAEFKNGILKVIVPKAETAMPKHVEVKT